MLFNVVNEKGLADYNSAPSRQHLLHSCDRCFVRTQRQDQPVVPGQSTVPGTDHPNKTQKSLDSPSAGGGGSGGGSGR